MTPVLLLLLGCPLVITDEEHAARLDGDGDGYDAAIHGGTDCDDGDAGVHPEAPEACNGRDDDCDGEVDEDAEDATTWYLDADLDGFGDPDRPHLGCAHPDEYVDDGTDCDDLDATTYPGGIEVCGGGDEDCDGSIDNEPVDGTLWYRDRDEDGWGLVADALLGCERPEYRSALFGDCNDDEPSTYPAAAWLELPWACTTDWDGDGYGSMDPAPGAVAGTDCEDFDGRAYPGAEEVWYDDTDQACDGGSDFDQDGDGFEVDDTGGGDDCDDEDPRVYPGAEEIWYDGTDQDCDGESDHDQDGDGYDADWTGGSDCDDLDASVSPDADEVWYDGTDQDCDGASDFDRDEDGFLVHEDCDDTDRHTYSGAAWAEPELDCATDADGDGWGVDEPAEGVEAGTDCDDGDSTVHPGADEVWYDDEDQDCDGASDWDADGDGHDWEGGDGDDCDDTDDEVHPDADELCVNLKDDDCSGTADDGCPTEEHSGTLAASETWEAGVFHLVTDTVFVEGATAPVLTIEDGAVVQFEAGIGLVVGAAAEGELRVQGDDVGVVFTSSGAASPGEWLGVVLGAEAGRSMLVGLDLGSAVVGLSVSSSVEITRCAVHDAEQDGISITDTSAAPGIMGTEVRDCGEDGIDASSGGLGEFVANVLTDNDGYPVRVRAEDLGALDASSSCAGNGEDAVWVGGGVVDGWVLLEALDVPYQVDGTLTVGTPTSFELMLDDGVQMRFATGAGLEIGQAGSGNLMVDGHLEGVLLTAEDEEWDGLTIGPYCTSAEVFGATVEHGGGTGLGAVVVDSGGLLLGDSTVSASTAHGVYVDLGEVSISNSTVEHSALDGVHLTATASISDLGEGGIGTSQLADNGAYPLTLPARAVGGLHSDNHIHDNGEDVVRVLGGGVSVDASWVHPGVPYLVQGLVEVGSDAGAQLELDAGVTLRFEHGAGLEIGTSHQGAFKVNGTSGDPVTFTSAELVPMAGDWEGITLGAECEDLRVQLTEAVIEYGGANGYGNLWFDGCSGVATDSTVTDSAAWGIYRSRGAKPELTGITYASNALGDLY